MFNYTVLLFVFIIMTGCATTSTAPIAGEKSAQDRLGSAIISPLSDLNLVQVTIPPVITEAQKNPYLIPSDSSCSVLAEEIHRLDAALGTDLDVISLRAEKTSAEQGGEFIQNEAIGGVERTINGVIPFRGWIRKLTGAERRSKELTAAIAAGIVRRAFLKGIGQDHGCKPPAAPVQHLPSEVPLVPASVQEIPKTIIIPPSTDVTSASASPISTNSVPETESVENISTSSH